MRFFFIWLLIFNGFITLAQTKKGELIAKWQNAKSQKSYPSDTGSVVLLNKLSDQYLYNHADSALYFAKQALQLAVAQKYIMGQAVSLNNISKTYYVLGDYVSSLDASDKSLNISNQIKYRSGIAGAYQIMALVYLAQDKTEDALTNFTRALKIFTRLNDLPRIGKIYFDIGICYDESGRSEKAFYYLNKATDIANRLHDNELLTMTLNRTGEANFHLKNYQTALDYYQQVAGSQFASNWEIDFAYSGMAQTYYKLGAYDKAVINAQKSLSLAKKVKSAGDVLRTLEILSESYAAEKDYKHAYDYHVQLKKLNDSVFNTEKDQEVNYLHLKQQQADNVRLRNDIAAEKAKIAFNRKLFIFRNVLTVCAIIFAFIIIRNTRHAKALNKVLQQQNTDIALQKEEISKQKEELHEINHTKDQLFSVISHDLRSPFAAILQTMDLVRSGDIPADEQAIVLNNFYQQVSMVTLMVNNLLIWANSQQAGIKSSLIALNITNAVDEVVAVSNFLAKNKNITLYHRYDGEKQVLADLDHIKIIIQNLIGNAIKFTPKGGAIEIYYTEDENYIAVHVKDNGRGISSEKVGKLFKVTGKEISGYGTDNEAGAGIGLALIRRFVDTNDGKIDVRSKPGGGSEFTVYFKRA